MLFKIHRDQHRHLTITEIGEKDAPANEALITHRNYTRDRRMRTDVELLCHGRMPDRTHFIYLCEELEDIQAAFTLVKYEGGTVQWETAVILEDLRARLEEVIPQKTAPTRKGYLFRPSLTKEGDFKCSFCGDPCTTRLNIHVGREARPQLLQLLKNHGITAEPLKTVSSMTHVGIGIAACAVHRPLLEQIVNWTAATERLYPEQLDQLTIPVKG